MQDVDPVALPGKGAELDVNQHRGTPRVGDIGLGDDVLARPRSVDLLVAQALRVEQADPVDRVGALPIRERAAVGNDELGVSRARRVDARVVDLAQLPAVERIPDLAAGAAGGPEAILVASDPVAGRARGTRRFAASCRGQHRRSAEPQSHDQRRRRAHRDDRPDPCAHDLHLRRVRRKTTNVAIRKARVVPEVPRTQAAKQHLRS